MSNRANRPQKKHNKTKCQRAQKHQPILKSLGQWVSLLSPNGKIATAFALILAVVGTYYAFSPKLLITSSYSLNQSAPLLTKFDIRNDSLLKVYDIKPVCKDMAVKMKGGGGAFGQGTVRTAHPPIPYLESGETTSFLLPLSRIKFDEPIESVDVTVVIHYRPSLLPLEKEKLTRFVTEKDSYGTLHWSNKAISDSPIYP